MEKRKIITYEKSLLLLGIIGLSMFLSCLISLVDTDSLWHYKLGEDIVKTLSLAKDNPYTWLEGTTWVSHELGYQVLFYLIINATGMFGFYLLYVINKVGWIYCIYLSNKKSNVLCFLLSTTALTCFVGMNRANRPGEFSIYFIIGLLYLYFSNNKYKLPLYLLLGTCVANFHGGAFLTMIALHFILVAVDVILDIIQKKKNTINYYVKEFAGIILLFLGFLINPYGLELLESISAIPGMYSTKFITEWNKPEFSYIYGIIFLLAIVASGYRIRKYNFNKVDIQKSACICAISVAYLTTEKNAIVFLFIYLMYAYPFIEEMIIDALQLNIKKDVEKEELPFSFKAIFVSISFICISVWGVFWWTEVVQEPTEDFIPFMTKENTPDNIMDYLKDVYTDDLKIGTEYYYGTFLLVNDMKAFVDPRQYCYTAELGKCHALDDLIYVTYEAGQDDTLVKRFFDKYKFDYFWVTTDSENIYRYLESTDEYKMVEEAVISLGVSTHEIYKTTPTKKHVLYKKVK